MLQVHARSVGVHVVGLNHPLGAKCLGPLIVPVRRLPAHIDGRSLAIFVLNNDRGSIVCLGPGQHFNTFVNVARANCQYALRFRTHQKPRHIQVMNGHITEDPSTAFDILKRRRRRVPGTQLNLDDFSDLIVDDGLFHTREIRVEPPLQRSHQLHVRSSARVDGLDRLHHIRGNGLLAENVLALLRAGLDLLGVEGARRAYPNRIDVGVIDHIVGTFGEVRDVVLLSGGLGLGDRRVGYYERLGIGATGEGFQVNQANSARTDYSDIDHFHRNIGCPA
mmetsp:Transcript_10504/g.15750  ORF Transcript_10504/g.15750 Transcript_10504/m.15750 type:complete len:278 (-) Transcript_10504:200-1033(-)